MPKGARILARPSACWEARMAVGASSATWAPFLTAWKMARAETIVLPEPTSPCKRRFIGVVLVRSCIISQAAVFCAGVNSNGREARNFLVESRLKVRGFARSF